MKKIILCADDYGQSPSISQAIVTLLEQKRLSATSCLTTAPLWVSHAKLLFPFKNQVDIGLHFNLTEGKPLSDKMTQSHDFMPLSKLVGLAHLRMLDGAAIEAELQAQLDIFESAMGQLPDFIDGHQHVHQLPVIRSVLMKVYEERLRGRHSYVRCVYCPKSYLRFGRNRYYIKMLILQLLSGAASFEKMLLKQQIPHNSSFSGVYQFHDSKRYAAIFSQFLREISDGGIIMCHPGLPSSKSDSDDPIAFSRHNEFQYLSSEQFILDCRRRDVVLHK